MATKSVKSLSKQLAGVAKQAKSLGINTSKADAMVKQTKREGSKSFSGSSEEKAYLSSIPAQMVAETVANMPPKPTVSDPGMPNLASNPNLASLGFTTVDNQFVYDPKLSEADNAINKSGQDQMRLLMQSLSMQQAPESKTDLYTNTYGVDPKQAQRDYKNERMNVSNYTNQLNSVVKGADAAKVALEGQGRGQTSGFIGGEQARINREAYIAAAPIQAQLEASQSNLQEATRHLDNLFRLQSEDADAKWKFQNDAVKAVLGIATQTQQNRLQNKLAEIGQKTATEKENLTYLRQLSAEARDNGNSNAIKQLATVNYKDENFNSIVANIAQGIRKPVVAKEPAKLDTQFDPAGNLVNMQTGEIISSAGGTTGAQALQKVETANDIEKILQLTDATLGESLGKRNIIQRNIPGTQEYQFSVQHDNLINQLALAARGELKGQGQVSDYEGKLLKSAQTTLNLYMAPKEYRKEAKQVLGAINTSSGIPQQVKITSKDGQVRYAVLGSTEIQEAVNQGYVIEYQ